MDIKQRFSDALDIPEEIVLDVPVIKIVSNNKIIIENHKGIIEYSKTIVRINSKIGTVALKGEDFVIKYITQDEIILEGEIEVIEFIK
ncbi:sporulation protein YqfC [Caloramator sp. CAR-1]|uniref:sporulation protein YqfC n=1 Tax=Caloramator sp. CAR-1 TaxID=3062777 RepID=UPI0026E1AD13|nr:sporulation protein YqfC [Caloramator sp. CAR-1]MDO6354474.1 sporulation protein YqfC [Caloramator sp. CAR-1]